MRRLFETVPVGVCEFNTDGVITLVNSALAKSLGKARTELLGTHVWEWLEPGPQRDGLPDYLRHLAQEQSDSVPYVCRTRRGVDLQADWTYRRNRQGEVVSFICALTDISERKRTEAELQQANERLESRVLERTAELTAANQRLEQEVAVRRQAEETLQRRRHLLSQLLLAGDYERQVMAYEIHDELAQLIAAARLQVQTSQRLRETDPLRSTELLATGLDVLQQCHAEARRLISGARPPQLAEQGLPAAIASLVQGLAAAAGPRIEFHANVTFDRLEQIEEHALYRVVQESLTNARKHSRSETVRVELMQYGDQLRVLIQDWGVGFEPGQVDSTCVGLAGIRERARLLGGRAEVDAAPGQGTRVTVEVPLMLRDNDG